MVIEKNFYVGLGQIKHWVIKQREIELLYVVQNEQSQTY